MELRPLGFGEIFDRAVTIYVRNFVPFVTIVMVLILPLAVMQYFMDVASQPQFEAMIRIFGNPTLMRTDPFPTLFDSPQSLAALGLELLVSYMLWPFVLSAVAVGVARLYRDRPVEFRACYENAIRRWPEILGLTGIALLVLLGWYIALIILALAMTLITVFLSFTLHALAFTGVIGALFILILMLPLLGTLVVALWFAVYATVIEERAVFESLGIGFSRVFNRTEFWRTVLFAVALGAIIFGASLPFSVLGMVAAMAHLPALQVIIQSIPTAIVMPLAIVILAVYYFDIRIRREAFDLEATLDRLTAAPV